MSVLKIEDLEVSFVNSKSEIYALKGVSFDIKKGEVLGVVGESGSGKSVTAKSIMGLIGDAGHIKNGHVYFGGQDLLKNTQKQWRKVRGNDIAMIFQDPMTSMNPVYTIGTQLSDVIRRNKKMSKKQSYIQAANILKQVGIPSPEKRLKSYPHEFSGGMLQRVMIAMALSCEPVLMIADEPTTALDVTIQAQILSLMKGLKNRTDASILMITHDLGVVAEICDRVVVMYGGFVMEVGSVQDIFYHAHHPYTKGLIASVQSLGESGRLKTIEGRPLDPTLKVKGCPFYERCEQRQAHCNEEKPPKIQISSSHWSMCWLNEKGGQ